MLIGIVSAGCESKNDEEARVREFVAKAVVLGEARDVSGISNIISEDYSDAEGRKQRDLVRMAIGYFLRNKNIHLFSRIDSINFIERDKARVRVNIAMAGQPVQSLESLSNLRAELMTFDLTLIQDSGAWLLQSAQWHHATLEDFISDDSSKNQN